METKYSFLPLDGMFIIEGKDLETNNVIIIQKFNPFTKGEFDTLEKAKEFAKDFYDFKPESDIEEPGYIVIRRTSESEEEIQPE
jgi:hypothetical protein